MKLIFGERNVVRFKDESDFYLCLGFLMNPEKGVKFDWERYANKWGIEGRIWIKSSLNAPISLSNSFSAGTESYDKRLNCNEYILYLYENYNIQNGYAYSFFHDVQSKIPKQYLRDFQRGFSLL